MLRSAGEDEKREEWQARFARWEGFLEGAADVKVIDTVHALVLQEPAVDEIAEYIDEAIVAALGLSKAQA